jgi:ribosome-associated translation inhibitor RaiA
MHKPPEIEFHDLPPSAGVAAMVRKRIGRLEQLYRPILSCRVTVQAPPQRLERGVRYAAQVRLSLPGRDILGAGEHGGVTPADSYVAVDEAFDAVQRELERCSRAAASGHSVAAALLV